MDYTECKQLCIFCLLVVSPMESHTAVAFAWSLAIDSLKVLRFSFPILVVGPSVLSRSLLPHKT